MRVRSRVESLSAAKQALLARRLRERAAGSSDAAGIVAVAREGLLPLSFGQERLWFVEQYEPNTDTYNVAHGLRWRGRLELAALDRALRALVERHESLRTVFAVEDGVPHQVIASPDRWTSSFVEVSGHADPEQELVRVAHAEARRPFDLAQGPLFRATIVRRHAEDHLIVLAMHHVATDGWSIRILQRELFALYAAFRTGSPSPLTPLALTYVDYAAWQRRQLEGPRLDAELAFWTRELAGAPRLELPTDRVRPALQTFHGTTHDFEVPADCGAALAALAREEGVTPFMAFLAAFTAVLARYAGQDEIVIGTGVANRSHAELDPLVGFFVNMLAVRVDLAENPTTRELFRRVRDRMLAVQEHTEVPFERVVEALRPPRDRSRHPIFHVTVTLFGGSEPEQLPDAVVEPFRWDISVAKFDLSLGIEDTNGRFRCTLEYNTDLFERATIERLAAHLVVLLEGMTARPDRPVAALPILTEAERRLLTRGASSEAPYDARPVHERFGEHVRTRPDQLAIVAGCATMTYAQLDARASAIEAALAQPGLATGAIVALCLQRGDNFVAAALAVLRAGCAYLPIDADSPPDRIAYMLADAQAAALVTTRALAAASPFRGRAVFVDEVPLGSEPSAARPVSPRDAAYVIYTSGTTGKPKGTIVEHAQLSHLVAWHERAFGLTAADHTTQLASVGFDAAVWEIWPTLACGATLHVIDDATRAHPEALRDALQSRGATIAFVPTPIAEQLLATTWPATTSLRYLLTGGDRLTRRPPPSAPYTLVNNYGPTECAVVSTSGVVTPDGDAPPSIGRAIDRVTALVLDAGLEPVPIGVPGELFIGGRGVARGYLGQPALTAERFVQDPEGPPGTRLYRTGDRVRRLPSGELEFLGRLDHQVKIRGFRIEVGEVEAALAALDGVRECCVIAHHAPPAEPRLVAYVAAAAGAALAVDGLRRALGRTLPDYMVPAAFVVVDGLPLTANGKVDRKALPAPDGSTLRAAAYVAPRTPLEASLAEIWSELLGVDRVGIEDDFFALGGHSLLATRLVARVHRALDVELPVRVLFEAPTVRALASLVVRNTAAPDDLPLVRVERDQPPQLSFAQERLWFLAQLEPDLTAYVIPLSLRLTGALDVRVLEHVLEEILRRHDVLRTTITAVDGKPVVRIAPVTELALPVVDMMGASEAEVQRYAESEAARPFDLARSALRVALLRVGHEEHVLLVSLHHIVTDGWSMQLLHRELSALYDAFAAGRASPLPALPIQFHDFAAWQRARMLAHGQRHLEFWKEHLAGAPPATELPTDRPHGRSQMHRGELETLVLDDELGDELVRIGQREGASLFMTMLAAFSVVLARLAGQGEVVVGAPIAQRTRPELEGLIGMFLNNLALRVDVSDNPSFRTLLRRVRANTLAAYEHQDAPFEKIVELLKPDRDLGRPPIFQVMLVASNFPREELRLGGLAITPVHLAAASSKYELTLYIDDTPDGLELAAVYSADLFDRARIRELLAQLACLIEHVVNRPDAPMLELALQTPTARRVLPDARAHLEQPSYEPVADTIAAIGRDHRSWIAIEWAGGAMTFGELATASAAAADALVGTGLGRGNVVAVRGRPSPGLVAWMLGVLRAGGALLLLDPALPLPRQIVMMRAAHARVLVHVGDEPVAEWTPEVVLRASSADGHLAGAPAEAATRPLPAIGGDDPAYVFFTSGTTGTPKGVLGCHKGLSHFVSWQRETFDVGPGDRAAQLTGLSFDVVLRDILTPLSSGATLCLRPEGAELEAEPLFTWMASSGVTMAHAVPSVMQVWLQERGAAHAPQLRLLFMAGEPLAAPLVERMREVFGAACRIINLYGPTETTLAKCFHEVAGAPRWGIQPVGRPMPHAQALVLNAAGAACGIGEPGEIVIRTPFRSLGYLDDPTGGRFVPSPFVDDPKDVVYRTGDRGRYAVDGTLEILGRIDDQVKIRGVRVEPAEVAAVLMSHPAVAQCVVTVQRTPEPALVAYVVLSDATCGESELRTYLAGRLVPAMVPKAFVRLDKLPLTANGKVDRRALPAPDEVLLRRGDHVAPRDPIEEALAAIWGDLLGVDQVGVHDDFFDLGGHSLLAMRVVAHVRRRFGVELSVRAFFETPTLEGLARELAPKRAAEPEVAPRGERPVLSFGQQRLWFLHQMDPDVNAHTLEAVHRYEGLDVEILRRAFEAVVARHEILRTSFPTANGEPYQHVHPPGPWELPVDDARTLDDAGQAEVLARVDAAQYRPFDLATGPLLRTRAVRVGPDALVLHVLFHHIILDGASLELFWRELWGCYDALAAGRAADVPTPARQYVDYAAWQRAWLSREEIERQLAFWTAYLAGAPEDTALPFKAPRPPRQTFGGRMHTVTVDAARAAPLRALVRQHGASLFMGISAAFRAVLLRYTGQADIVLGTFITNRASAEFDDVLGLFVNTLVLRNEVRDDDTFASLLARERNQTLAAYDHQHTPFELVVDALGVERSLSRTPVFQVMHTHQGELTAPERGLDTGAASTAATKTTVDLLLMSGEQDGRLVLTFFYNTDLFDHALIEQLARHLQHLIDGVAHEPRRPLFEIPLLDEDDRAHLRDWGSPPPATEQPRFVHELIADHVARTPDAIAVEHASTRLTYRELAARSERVAAWLAQRGITRGARVALCLERSADMVAALLGVLRLGAAYVPIDPEYPLARRELMRRDAGAAVELTDEALREALSASGPAPRAEVEGEDVVYVIYTSGSTGTPKGVRVPHRSVANYLAAMRGPQGVTASDTIAAIASLSFDAHVIDILLPLANGARSVIADRDTTRDGERLARLLDERGVTFMFATPATWRALLATGWRPSPSLRAHAGGEAVPPDLAAALLAHAGSAWNGYGPTETTVYVSCTRLVPGQPVTIGRPLRGLRAYVLDPHGHPAPIGVAGELYVGGAGVALGYHDRPGLTAERFLPDPFAGDPGARMYRTGDRVRWTRAGALEYLGRVDTQIKLRGLRIELGEIEAAVRTAANVEDLAVALREDVPGNPQLVAYVATGGSLDEAALRAMLRTTLPEYMVPTAFVALPALPLSANGKLDRRALPAPDLDASSAYVAPRDAIEQALAEIWGDVLSVPRVGIHDDFFALGGHSLLAIRLLAQLRTRFAVELPVRELFATPTLEGLARELAARAAPPLVRIARDGELPLSFAQERLWFLSQLEPDSTAYTMSITLRLRGALDARVLERAIDELFQRHEVLRSTIASVDGKPRLAIRPATPRELPILDVTGASDDEIRRHAEALEGRPFDLAETMVRVTLLRVHATEHVLLVPMHHLITDGWSIELVVRELFTLYAAYAAGKPSPLAPLPLDFVDFAAWQRATMTADRAERSLAYWTKQLAGAPPAIELPTDRPHRARQTHRGEWESILLDRALTDRVLELGRREGTSLFMTMLAALAVVLDRQAGQGEVVIGAPISQRSRPELENMLGLFLNTLALRVDVADRPSFRALLQRVRETALAAHEHQDVPFEQIVERLRPERNLSRPPIFQVMLVATNFPQESLHVEGLSITAFDREDGSSRYDFTLYTDETAAGLQLAMAYNADLFDRVRMKDLLSQLEALLVEVTAHPDAPARSIDAYALMTPAARGALPDPRAPLDDRWYGAVSEVFARAAAAQPERVAVVDAREEWTYGELEQRANQLAHYLIAAGVQKGERVAIAAERTAGLAWAVLGVLKAGAAFVMLDPAYPEARRVEMLEATGARALVRVATAPLPAALAAWCTAAGVRVNLELPARSAIGTRFDHLPSTPPAISLTADDLAYVAFTSGSAGRPKGVLGRHGPLSHFHAWRCQEFGLTRNDRFTMLSGLAHDPLHRDLFTPLSLGASLHVLDAEAMKTPGRLAGWMASEQITVTHLTPALGRLVTETAEEAVPSLRWIFLVGEALMRRDVDAVHQVAPRAVCVNYYGTTETQQALAYHVVRRAEATDDEAQQRAVSPLGRGAPDVQLLVITPAGRLAGVGELGEIYVRSPHLAAGYLDDAELTAARFMPNPLNPTAADDRTYRTGDLGRYTPSGEVVFAGRGDLQVKVRGFRIELAEVEAALAAQPSVTEAVVVAHDDERGDTYLAAYVVARDLLAPESLRAFLRATLPDYMVPSAFVQLDRLPLTPNGKIDRKALPAPALDESRGTTDAPMTPLEGELAAIWRTVLRVEQVGVDDDFFELGGHSLLAVQVIARMRRQLDLDLMVQELFEAPTIRELAKRFEQQSAPATRDLPIRPPARGARPPLSFAQHRLWFLHQLDPSNVVYQIGDVRHIDGLDVVALRRAFEELIARHESLRTTFPAVGGEPYQHIHPPTPWPLPIEDARALDEADRAAVLARVEAAQRGPFDLARGPLFRTALVRLGDTAYVLLVTLHHIITDGWSQDVFWRELWTCYDALVSGHAAALPPMSLQYADYAAWQRGWLAGSELERQLAFWTQRLAGAPEETPLPIRGTRPQRPSTRAHEVVDVLDREVSSRLYALAQREGATLFMTLLAGFRVFLAGVTGQGDLVIGTPIANRNHVELEGLIGFFVNTLALRGVVVPDEAFTSLLARERADALAAYGHQDAPFELVVDALDLERRLDLTPLFQVWFVHQNTPHDAPIRGRGVPELATSAADLTTKFDLTLHTTEYGDQIGLTWLFSADLFEEATITQLVAGYRALLALVATQPHLTIAELLSR